LKIKSKALEVNLADYHVDVDIDKKYHVLQEAMSKYYGLMESLNTFLRELSHPYRNWRFIVSEARKYALEYFHLLKSHPDGPAAADRLLDIFIDAITRARENSVKADAVDNLLLYLQKIVKDAGRRMEDFCPVVDRGFNQINSFPDDVFDMFVKSFYPLNRLAALYGGKDPSDGRDWSSLNELLIKYFRFTYRYWLQEVDPLAWFEQEISEIDVTVRFDGFFRHISHAAMREASAELSEIGAETHTGSKDVLLRLLELPGNHQIVDEYRAIPQRLFEAGEAVGYGHHVKLIFLFHVMSVSGLYLIHEETLRDINLTLSWIIENENYRNIENLIRKTFAILKERAQMYPATALNCVLNMGKGVYNTDEIDLVNFFIDSVVDLGFQTPMLQGVDNDWQIRVNEAHLLNIRTWLELIELNPKWSTRLLSGLIIHLSLCGVFIRDIDLFPRDITHFLNSRIAPVYNLAKQLTRLLPVFFNDIGAEGKLRDISTRIDEIQQRRDVLVHFLRKQSHVESNNQIVDFMKAVLVFWHTRRKEVLESYLPPAIFDQVASHGPLVDGMHRIFNYLGQNGLQTPDKLLTVEESQLKEWIADCPDVSDTDRERAELAVSFFKLLHQKYHFDYIELDNYLAQLRPEALPDFSRIEKVLPEKTTEKKLFVLLDYLEELKAVILSEKSYEIREDIYKKRHITIDIPSMYGSYHEMKFDCLGLTFRIESLVNVLFEELVDQIDLSLITKATFFEIHRLLSLFDKALRLDGLYSVEFERQLEFLAHSLEVRGFTLTQYLDIFKGFAQAVKNIINDYFNNLHGQNLNRILTQIPLVQVLPKFRLPGMGEDRDKFQHLVSEMFFRDRIALSLGLQQLDLFLSRILSTLFQQSYKLPKDKLQRLLLYDPQSAMTPVDESAERITGIIQLGNKGLNLVRLKKFGFPVPPAFVITTEVFRCREIIDSYPPAEKNFKEHVLRNIAQLEAANGKVFGNPDNPLLLSIRSGSSISQPGMMDTLLNVGINEKIAVGLAKKAGNAWFAWDNYRRFLQSYGMAFGMKRDDFDAIIRESKATLEVPFKRDLTGEQMKSVALAYKRMIREAGIDIVDDPVEQLFLAIRSVLDSWESSKARTYRRIMGISDDWGTAVSVQAMVYGNLSARSGSGVIFTHNPRWSADTMKLWGDFTAGNQGEDVVAGLVKTMPVSIFQQEIEMRDTDVTLETHYPEIYKALKSWAHRLIDEKGWSPQEIEFTFESPAVQDLYILQTRDMAIRERSKVLAFDSDVDLQAAYLGHGIGVSGGAMSGRLVFTLEEIEEWRVQEPDTSLILARSDTVPDDIQEINAADGLLTARGGLTSHAAVVAHRLGKTCVVGCSNLDCNEMEETCTFHQKRVGAGKHISIDGQEGSVYQGLIPTQEA
jgi:pyruvate,orthophosphate dikinase